MTPKKLLTAECAESLAEYAEKTFIRALLRELRVISAVKGFLLAEPSRRDQLERWVVLCDFGKGIDTCVWLNRKEFLDCALVTR